MEKKKGKSRKKVAAVILSAVILLAGCFFTVDLLRAKRYGLPPLFCFPVIEYENGSTDYYGLFYKVWKDYHPFEKTVDYYVGFWFIPKFWNI